MAEFAKREREAWRLLPGCEATPSNPYTEAHLAGLLAAVPAAPTLRAWADVVEAWESHGCTAGLVLVSVLRGRIAAASTYLNTR